MMQAQPLRPSLRLGPTCSAAEPSSFLPWLAFAQPPPYPCRALPWCVENACVQHAPLWVAKLNRLLDSYVQ
jgi:hypothetical protein